MERVSQTQHGRPLPWLGRDSARPHRHHGMCPLTQRLSWSLRRLHSALNGLPGTPANPNTLVCVGLSFSARLVLWGSGASAAPPPADPHCLRFHPLPLSIVSCLPLLHTCIPSGLQTHLHSPSQTSASLSQRHSGVTGQGMHDYLLIQPVILSPPLLTTTIPSAAQV